MADDPQVEMTNKLPALILAMIAGAIAIVSAYRGARWVALAFAILSVCFLWYSLSIKEWCKATGPGAFSSGFHSGLGECIKQKGWLEL